MCIRDRVTDAKLLNENAPLTYADYQNRVKPKKKEIPQDKKIVGWRCKICNYVYEGSELPADYICPICEMCIRDRFNSEKREAISQMLGNWLLFLNSVIICPHPQNVS